MGEQHLARRGQPETHRRTYQGLIIDPPTGIPAVHQRLYTRRTPNGTGTLPAELPSSVQFCRTDGKTLLKPHGYAAVHRRAAARRTLFGTQRRGVLSAKYDRSAPNWPFLPPNLAGCPPAVHRWTWCTSVHY